MSFFKNADQTTAWTVAFSKWGRINVLKRGRNISLYIYVNVRLISPNILLAFLTQFSMWLSNLNLNVHSNVTPMSFSLLTSVTGICSLDSYVYYGCLGLCFPICKDFSLYILPCALADILGRYAHSLLVSDS